MKKQYSIQFNLLSNLTNQCVMNQERKSQIKIDDTDSNSMVLQRPTTTTAQQKRPSSAASANSRAGSNRGGDGNKKRAPYKIQQKCESSKGKVRTLAQKQLMEIEETFKALRHLPKQKLHPFDFPAEELLKMKVLFPEHKPIPEGMPKNSAVRNQGITVYQLMNELKSRINIDEKAFLTMIGQLDRKNDNKVTWDEFLNFLTNEGVRRETVNDANLYGYGVKRLSYQGRHNLRLVDQFNGPEKLAEYYIDGMVLIKLKSARLVLNLFENKEAKLFDLRTKLPVQNLTFDSDYAKPKLKKHDAPSMKRKAGACAEVVRASSLMRMSTQLQQEQSVRSDIDSMVSHPQHLASGLLSQSGDAEISRKTPTSNLVVNDYSNMVSRPRQQSDIRKGQDSKLNRFKQSNRGKSQPAGSGAQAQSEVISNFVDQDIEVTITTNSNKAKGTPVGAYSRKLKLPLTASKQPGGKMLTPAASDFGGSQSTQNRGNRTTQFGRERAQTQLTMAASESEFNEKPVSAIRAWRQHGSYHRELSKTTNQNNEQKKEQEEKDKRNCMILGLADLTSKNSARDFANRANEKEKAIKGKVKKNQVQSVDVGAELRKGLDEHRKEFNKKLDGINKKLKKYDDGKEAQFFQQYKLAEVDKKKKDEDELRKSQFSYEKKLRRGSIGGAVLKNEESYSNSGGLRSGKSLGVGGGRRRKATDPASDLRAIKVKVDKSNLDGYINREIDYFGKCELVETASKTMNYTPLALRDHKSLSKLCSQHIDVLRLEDTKCQRALQRTRERKTECMKSVMRIKETNRYFFTQNPAQPAYYYPEKSYLDERAVTTKSKAISQAEEAQKLGEIGMEAMRDYNMLFGDQIVPVPCDANRIKKALYERRIRDNRTKEDIEMEAAALAKKEREQKVAKKLKTTKEIYTVAADYCLSPDGMTARVALALIDQQILVYQVKQSGAKVTMVESFSFFVKFPDKAAVSALCLDHYVTNSRPIVCIGSQIGDIAIYYIDHINVNGIVCQKQVEMFNFFERGPKIEVESKDEAETANPDEESHNIERQVSDQRGGKSFVDKFVRSEGYGSADLGVINKTAASDLELKKQAYSMNVKEPAIWIRDDFWNVLTNTRTNAKGYREQGPNGITLWNTIFPKKVPIEENAIALCNSLMAMKLESLDEIDHIVTRWKFWLHEYGNDPKEAIADFEREMEESRDLLLAKEVPTRATKQISKSGDSKKPQRKKSSALLKGKIVEKASILLNSISEEELENKSDVSIRKRKTGGDKQFSNTMTTKINSKKPAAGAEKSSHKPAQISKIRYVRDIGLIVTTFSGHIKFFDAFNFFTVWKNSNKLRKENQHTSICTFDISSPLGIMVTGGAEGLILAIDPHALGVTNHAEAAKGKDILNVFIFDEQQQVISLCVDRTVTLWDAFRLVKLQTIKDIDKDLHIPKFSAACFDQKDGILYIGDQMLSVWNCSIDPTVEINALQIQTLSETMARERNLQPLMEVSRQFSKQPMRSGDVRNGRVLISDKMSSLVDILCDEAAISDNFFATVDTENLCRFWNIREHRTNITFKIPMKKRITACDINQECTLIAVGNSIGEAFVANKLSGGVIYRLSGADDEISCIKFLNGQSEFWIVAALWHGKMMFWSQPNEQNNFTINAKMRIGHRGDINTIDCQSNYIISGGQDGLLGVWNQFSGILKYAIKLPDAVDVSQPFAQEKMKNATSSAMRENESLGAKAAQASNQIRRTIVDVMFHPYWRNVALVLQEGGNVHAVDVSNGMIVNDFLAMVQNNSRWAIDPYSYNIMVVGDQGKAILLDARMGAASKQRQMGIKHSFWEKEQPEKLMVSSKRVPTYKAEIDPRTKQLAKWSIIQNWFTAHSLSKTEAHFVNSVRFSGAMSIFLTSTNFGEVKLWKSESCQSLGVLNSINFSPETVTNYIKSQAREGGEQD